MGAFRVSLAGLLGIVLAVGLGMAALGSATAAWVVVVALATLGLLQVAVLGILYRKGPARGFWTGFALFGWSWLVLVNWSWLDIGLEFDLTSSLRGLAESVYRPETAARMILDGRDGYALTKERARAAAAEQVRLVAISNFAQIGRFLLCLAFALAGGVVGRAFAAGADAARGSQSGTS